MSKGLEVLHKLYALEMASVSDKNMTVDKAEKYRADIEKHLKALEVIVKKNVIIPLLKDCSNFQEYNDMCHYCLKYAFRNFYSIDLLQEEFDLIKEVVTEHE